MFSDISSRVQETLSGVRVIRAYVQERAELARFAELNRAYIHENLRLARISGLFNPLLQALVGIGFLMVLWMGGMRLAAHKISLGSFVMFNTYMGMLVWPMIAMGWVANLMERGKASLGRVRELLDERPRIAAPAHPRALPDPLRNEIEFRCVSVTFGQRRALEDVSLRIPAGATVAIVGHTGSGKTTLAQMVPRLAAPNSSSATGERILNQLTSVMRGRTTILISHRVSTIRSAQIIFVLEHGTVVDQGTHAELLERGGYYADLYQKQLLEEELEAI